MTTLADNTHTQRRTGLSVSEFQEFMIESVRGLFNIYSLYIGHRLGLYKVLAGLDTATAETLAEEAGIAKRYAREWLEQQAVAGVLDVLDPTAAPDERQFRLPPGPVEVLTNEESLDYLAPLPHVAIGAARPIEALLGAFKTGDGIPYAAYGDDLRHGQGAMNRAAFLQLLGKQWLPAVPDIDERLRSKNGARVADVGCGVGWSSIGIAQGYPNVRVDGYDLDLPSIEEARQAAEQKGVDDRVTFHHRDAGDPQLEGQYDLVIALECIHDMGRPVEALRAMRKLAGDHGSVLIVDERVADEFMGKDGDVDWMMYGWSLLHCLPVGIADCNGCGCAATGTVMRTPTLEKYATEAGFARLEVLPIDNYFFRFYRLHV